MNTRLNHVQNWPDLAQKANWSVTTMAKDCGVSSRSLQRHFLKTFGKSPKTWLLEQRQKKAVEFLQRGSSVKEVSSKVGYQHVSAFSRQFKKIEGDSPIGLFKAGMEMSRTDNDCRV